MPRPKEGYKTKDGQPAPGVTTVISQNLAWSKGALIGWAYNMGKAGKPLRDTQDEAMSIGTIAHSLIEMYLRNETIVEGTYTPEQKDKVENCLLAFWEWRDGFKPEVIKSEFPLVSELHRFGCTPDHLIRLGDRLCLLEVKTGTGDSAYSDWRIQMSAQGAAVNECGLGPISGYHLLKVGKDDASFAHFYWPQLDQEWEVFTLLLSLERLRKAVSK